MLASLFTHRLERIDEMVRMFTSHRVSTSLASAILIAGASAQAQTFAPLHQFAGPDGANPYGSVAIDSQDIVYGTAGTGGRDDFGTLWSLTMRTPKTPKLSTLVTFNGNNGRLPLGGLQLDGSGNLYGTTYYGGKYDAGTVFVNHRDKGSQIVHAFKGGAKGDGLYAGVVLAGYSDGIHLVGATFYGGDLNIDSNNGCGTVYDIDLTARNKFSVLHTFIGTDGCNPASTPSTFGGRLYGTTVYGGPVSGSPYSLNFDGSGFATIPPVPYDYTGSLTADGSGNLWGTALAGGTTGAGTIFKIDAAGAIANAYNFTGGTDGLEPVGTLVFGLNGVLYGVTHGNAGWNDEGNAGGAPGGWGTVFAFDTNTNTLTTLHSFQQTDGANPASGVVVDVNGDLYGVTPYGGANDLGVIYQIVP
jgi:uncharacterized repeat protein (TIGR03803 family)